MKPSSNISNEKQEICPLVVLPVGVLNYTFDITNLIISAIKSRGAPHNILDLLFLSKDWKVFFFIMSLHGRKNKGGFAPPPIFCQPKISRI